MTKRIYICPKIKTLEASCHRLMENSPWVVGDDEVPFQGAKGGSFFGIDDYEETYDKPNYNVWDY